VREKENTENSKSLCLLQKIKLGKSQTHAEKQSQRLDIKNATGTIMMVMVR